MMLVMALQSIVLVSGIYNRVSNMLGFAVDMDMSNGWGINKI
jgi:hypothetical protein